MQNASTASRSSGRAGRISVEAIVISFPGYPILTVARNGAFVKGSNRAFWCTRFSRCTRRATPCCKEGKDVLAWRLRRHASTSFPLSDPRAGREQNGHTMQFRKTKKPWVKLRDLKQQF